MRRVLAAMITCGLAALFLTTVPAKAQKNRPAPPPPAWWVVLPAADEELPVGTTDSVPAGYGLLDGFARPILYAGDDAGAYASGQAGITITVSKETAKNAPTYTVIHMTVAQTSARKVGVQGLQANAAYDAYVSPNTPICNFSTWQDGVLSGNPVAPAFFGCITNFFGDRDLWNQTLRGRAHPPAPYDRFELIVRVPTDISLLADGEFWEGWPLCTSTDLWFADYANPSGTCDASNWSSTGGGFVRNSGWFQVRRIGNSWTIVGYRAEQRVNEWPDVLVEWTRGNKTTTSCRSAGPAYYEVTTPIRYWLTIGY